MRILSLGCGLPDPSVDNYNWASALSFFDYDAVVVDPAEAVSKLVGEVTAGGGDYATYDDVPIVAGPTTADAVGLADLLRRRREETERFLAKGGLLVCFAYPDVPHPDVPGFTGCHRYYWLPAPAGKDYGPGYVKPAGGRQVRAADFEHAFAGFLEDSQDRLLYRAVFAEGAAGFGRGARVIGRSAGGAAVAVELAVAGGRVVFLPALAPRLIASEVASVARSLVAAIRNALLLEAEAEPPAWLDTYLLPGVREAERKVEELEAKLEELEGQLAEARNEYRAIDRYRRLLWQEGKYGFDLPVRDALAYLGFTSIAPVDEPATFMFAGERVLVETEAGAGAIGMEPHYRLRQRLERQIAASGSRARGIIVVNGFREVAPQDRPPQVEQALRVAAESMRYCVVEAAALFEAVRAKMEGRGDAEAFCRRLLETEGVFTPEPPPPEGAAAGAAAESTQEASG